VQREHLEAVRIIAPERIGLSPFLVVCDHASNALPAEFGTLGLPPSEFARHIAWDPGAAALVEALAARLAAPASRAC
jgi:predicted N-formylglutamate amidohydrolase